jgi:hypothetical protein
MPVIFLTFHPEMQKKRPLLVSLNIYGTYYENGLI